MYASTRLHELKTDIKSDVLTFYFYRPVCACASLSFCFLFFSVLNRNGIWNWQRPPNVTASPFDNWPTVSTDSQCFDNFFLIAFRPIRYWNTVRRALYRLIVFIQWSEAWKQPINMSQSPESSNNKYISLKNFYIFNATYGAVEGEVSNKFHPFPNRTECNHVLRFLRNKRKFYITFPKNANSIPKSRTLGFAKP